MSRIFRNNIMKENLSNSKNKDNRNLNISFISRSSLLEVLTYLSVFEEGKVTFTE